MQRTRTVGVAVLALLALAAIVYGATRSDRNNLTTDRSSVILPDGPPRLAGTAFGSVFTSPCNRDCIDGVAAISLPGSTARLLSRHGSAGLALSPAGAIYNLVASGDGYAIENARTGATIWQGADTGAIGFGAFADGRFAVLVVANDGPHHVDVIDPGRGETRVHPLADRQVSGVAVGPGGRIAVLTECCDRGAHLTVIEPSGGTRIVHLPASLDIPNVVMAGQMTLSWGPSDLIAISANQPYVHAQGDRFPWGARTVVIDDTGHVYARLNGWQGLAWSRDGLGLLVARPASGALKERRYDVEVRYGAELRQHRRVGTVPFPVAPLVWSGA